MNSSEPTAASETELDTHRLGASVFVVNHVDDFDGFTKFFEEGAAARANIGVRGQNPGLWNPIEIRKALYICVANHRFTALAARRLQAVQRARQGEPTGLVRQQMHTHS